MWPKEIRYKKGGLSQAGFVDNIKDTIKIIFVKAGVLPWFLIVASRKYGGNIVSTSVGAACRKNFRRSCFTS